MIPTPPEWAVIGQAAPIRPLELERNRSSGDAEIAFPNHECPREQVHRFAPEHLLLRSVSTVIGIWLSRWMITRFLGRWLRRRRATPRGPGPDHRRTLATR